MFIQCFRSGFRLARTIVAATFLTTTLANAQEFVDPPEDQSVYLSETATFSVEPRFGDLSFQWIRQWSDHAEILKGQTASSLTISNAQISDVGQYFCAVQQGEQIQFTRAASLTVGVFSAPIASKQETTGIRSQSLMTAGAGGGTITLYATPSQNGGSSGTCPGSYAGYVYFTKPVSQGWGWAPTAGVTSHTATDATRTDTTVQYTGKNVDVGCNQTSVAVPDPTVSPKYRFTIYFYNNVPTNAYAITLSGFDP